MHHVGVAFHDHLLRERHGADFCHPADVVAPQVDEHEVFGDFLRVGQELALEGLVLLGCGAPGAGPCEGAIGNHPVFYSRQDFRGARHEL